MHIYLCLYICILVLVFLPWSSYSAAWWQTNLCELLGELDHFTQWGNTCWAILWTVFFLWQMELAALRRCTVCKGFLSTGNPDSVHRTIVCRGYIDCLDKRWVAGSLMMGIISTILPTIVWICMQVLYFRSHCPQSNIYGLCPAHLASCTQKAPCCWVTNAIIHSPGWWLHACYLLSYQPTWPVGSFSLVPINVASVFVVGFHWICLPVFSKQKHCGSFETFGIETMKVVVMGAERSVKI